MIAEKSKSLELQLYSFLLKVMWKQWYLMDHCISAQRMHYPQLYHTLKQCMRVNDFPLVTVYWPCNSNTPSLCFKIFNRLTAWAPVLQLLQGSVEIWVQFCSCKVFTYHKISSINLLLTMLTTTWWHWISYTFHGMGVVTYVILGRSTVRRFLCRAVKMDELQAVGHNYICNCVTFFCADRPQWH